MASQEAWQFANEDCGRRFWRWGWILLVPLVLAMLPIYGANDDTVGALGGFIVLADCVLMVLMIIPTERALKRKFE